MERHAEAADARRRVLPRGHPVARAVVPGQRRGAGDLVAAVPASIQT